MGGVDREAQLEAKLANIERKLERAERSGESEDKIIRLRNKLATVEARLDALDVADESVAADPPSGGASGAESDSAGDAVPKVRESRSTGSVDHTAGGEYTHPPTQADINKASTRQNQADKDFLRTTPGAIRSGAPAWCYEAPGSHGSGSWDSHCAPPSTSQDTSDPPDRVREAQANSYIDYMRSGLDIEWNSDGSVMRSVCHEDPDGDGTYTLRSFSGSNSGALASECSSVGNGAWWTKP